MFFFIVGYLRQGLIVKHVGNINLKTFISQFIVELPMIIYVTTRLLA